MLSTATTRTLSCADRLFLSLSLTAIPPRILDLHVQSVGSGRVSSVKMFSVAPTQIFLTPSQPASQPAPIHPISLTPLGCDGLVGRWGEETHWSCVHRDAITCWWCIGCTCVSATFERDFFYLFFYGCPRSESESPLLSTAYPLYHSCSFYYWNAFFGLFVNDCFFMDFAALLRIVFTLRCLHSYWETWMLMLNISIPGSDCFLSFAPSAVVFCFVCFFTAQATDCCCCFILNWDKQDHCGFQI